MATSLLACHVKLGVDFVGGLLHFNGDGQKEGVFI